MLSTPFSSSLLPVELGDIRPNFKNELKAQSRSTAARGSRGDGRSCCKAKEDTGTSESVLGVLDLDGGLRDCCSGCKDEGLRKIHSHGIAFG